MGNKTNFNNYKQSNAFDLSKTHVNVGGIQKRVHEVKTSRVGKKAREIVRKNLSFFVKGLNFQSTIKYSTTNDHSSNANSQNDKLPATEEEDRKTHEALRASLAQEYALHASPSWQYVASTVGEQRFPDVEALPRTWKDSLQLHQIDNYCFTPKQAKYQELVYEIVLTEQSYVDGLILVYKIFMKEALRWNGLRSSVRHLFENVFQIIRLHLQLLKDLRSRQISGHPVINSITDIFRSYATRFDVYSSYFSNFEKASNILADSIKSNDEFGAFITRRSLWNECRNLPLAAYLLTPIQRVMKYPLFFKSLSECLSENDGDMENIQSFLVEMDIILRYFEKQKKESEDFIKLEDLAARIKGLEGSTIHIAEHGRRLIYEGYLTIIPGTQQHIGSYFDESPRASFSSSAPPSLSRRNSTFSLSSRRQERAYIFLFNDMIVCTRERNKRRSPLTDSKAMAPPSAKGSYYGPSPDSLFKITHTPGKLTLVDRAVMREVVHGSTDKSSRRGSALFQSLRRYGSRINDDLPLESPSTEFPSSPFSMPSYNDSPQQQHQACYEKHPLQFICSIATRNLTNIHFETETPEEKEAWCNHLESVLNEHVQRDRQPQGDNSNYTRTTLSPCHSSYSFESASSSSESLTFSTAWTGYCDVEKMDVDGEQQQEQDKLVNGPPVILDKSQELLNAIMSEFDDSIWSIGAPPGMSPYQLRKTFSSIGSDM